MDFAAIKNAAEGYQAEMSRFLRDMIAIPSESCEEEGVVKCIAKEMEKLGYDKVEIDKLGNVIGWLGEGEKIIAIDSHIDTVGIGNRANWTDDPYEGWENETQIYGRGGSDQEGGLASAVYGAKIMKDLGLIPAGYKLMIVGSVQEEDCDGMCWQYIANRDFASPEEFNEIFADIAQGVSEMDESLDIGVVVLDNKRITITTGAMEALLENNAAVITCDSRSMPTGLMLPLYGNTLQNERFRDQLDASLPLRKQLWQQTVKQKIANQEVVLRTNTDAETRCMKAWVEEVRSGDADNLEARAAAYYWRNLCPNIPNFVRGRDGEPPNNLLNYGYAILRGVVARSLVSSGLLPTLGIHHHNRYNAYCLADDIMEPYRPYVDELVIKIIRKRLDYAELTKELKAELLVIPVLDVIIDGKRSPLMIAASQTTASLYKCFSGELRKISYPQMES